MESRSISKVYPMSSVREIHNEIEYPVVTKTGKEEDSTKKPNNFCEEMPSLNELFSELNDFEMNNDGDYVYNEQYNETNPNEKIPENLDDVINKALLSMNEGKDDSNTNSIADFSPFDTPISVSTVTDEEAESGKKEKVPKPTVNLETLTSVKNSMANTSKLIGLFTTLKTTYLKLCKEFNYLLSKFNENEKVKVQLIQENLKLKNLLSELLINREQDRKTFKLQLNEERKKRKLD
jgi:hypothetical protein